MLQAERDEGLAIAQRHRRTCAARRIQRAWRMHASGKAAAGKRKGSGGKGKGKGGAAKAGGTNGAAAKGGAKAGGAKATRGKGSAAKEAGAKGAGASQARPPRRESEVAGGSSTRFDLVDNTDQHMVLHF